MPIAIFSTDPESQRMNVSIKPQEGLNLEIDSLDGGPRYLVFEPVTAVGVAAVIAAWLAQGAVNYAGGLVLAKILGHPTLQNIENQIRDAIEEIKSFVRQELRKQLTEFEIAELAQRVASGVNGLRHYSLSTKPKSDIARGKLLAAHEKARDAYFQAKRFGIQGAFVAADAVSLFRLSCEVLHQIEPDGGHRASATDLTNEATTHLSTEIGKFEDAWDPEKRVSDVRHKSRHILEGSGGREGEGKSAVRVWDYFVLVDGEVEYLSRHQYQQLSKEKVEEMRRLLVKRLAAKRDAAVEALSVPLRAVVDIWRQPPG